MDEARSRLLLRVHGAEQSGVDHLEATMTGVADSLSALQRIIPDLSVGAVVNVSEATSMPAACSRSQRSWTCCA